MRRFLLVACALAIASFGSFGRARGQDITEVFQLKHPPESNEKNAHVGQIADFAFLPDGTLLTGGADGSLRHWDMDTGKQLQLVAQQASPITRVALSPDGTKALSFSAIGAIRVWLLPSDRSESRLVKPALTEELHENPLIMLEGVSYSGSITGDMIGQFVTVERVHGDGGAFSGGDRGRRYRKAENAKQISIGFPTRDETAHVTTLMNIIASSMKSSHGKEGELTLKPVFSVPVVAQGKDIDFEKWWFDGLADAERDLFPVVPPIADVDASVRHAVSVRVPTEMSVARDGDKLTVRFPKFESSELMVGKNMATGAIYEAFVSEGHGSQSLFRALNDDIDFKPSESILTLGEGVIPPRGKAFVLEYQVTVFETDVPAQHMWSPESGKHFKVLWTKTFQERVK